MIRADVLTIFVTFFVTSYVTVFRGELRDAVRERSLPLWSARPNPR